LPEEGDKELIDDLVRMGASEETGEGSGADQETPDKGPQAAVEPSGEVRESVLSELMEDSSRDLEDDEKED
jgi:hypothetical protein